MCNRARFAGEPETIHERFGSSWAQDVVRPNVALNELAPRARAYVVREEASRRVVDVMRWDVLGGQGRYPMTNVCELWPPQWRKLAERPGNRCLVPLTEFYEWTPGTHDVGGGKPIKGEMWFRVIDQPVFAVAGFWQRTAMGTSFAMVTCDPNELVAPVHPKAMITILREADWDRWLTCPLDDVETFQQPYPAELMTVRGPVFPTSERQG